MVFTLVDRLLGGIPSHTRKERFWNLEGHLQTEGFTKTEASNITWIINHRMAGEVGGLALGLGIVYFGDRTVKQWCLRNPWIGVRHFGLNGVRLAVVGTMYFGCGFLTTFPHKGSNSHLSSMFSTDMYQKTRSLFVTQFQVLNRNFTEEEVDQFLNNEDLKR